MDQGLGARKDESWMPCGLSSSVRGSNSADLIDGLRQLKKSLLLDIEHLLDPEFELGQQLW